MNLFNLMREMQSEGYAVTLFDYGNHWIFKAHTETHRVEVRRPTPEEAIRCAYLELNPLPRSGAI